MVARATRRTKLPEFFRLGQILHESHVRIYSTLAAGDAEQARSEMRDHLRAAYSSLLDEVREPPPMNGVRAAGSDS